MSVVVSDTSPLHYLILCGTESILPRLFQQVIIPPTVYEEMRQQNTPAPVRQWTTALPEWIIVKTPKAIDLNLDIDQGELEAICLAKEINADAILMDDRAGRNAAISSGVAVIGTIGLMEAAAARGLIDLASAFERLKRTNVRLDPEIIRAALRRDQERRQKP